MCIEPVTAFDYDLRRGVRELESDHEVADIRSCRPCVDEIATRCESRARVCTAHTIVGIYLCKYETRTGLAVHKSPGVIGHAVSSIRPCSEQHHLRLSREQPGGCQRKMLISATAAGIWGQLHGRLSAPYTHLRRIQVQLVGKANSKSGSVIVEAAGRPPDIESQFLGSNANALYRVVQRGNDGSFNSVLKIAGGSEQPRSDDGRVIAGNVGNK